VAGIKHMRVEIITPLSDNVNVTGAEDGIDLKPLKINAELRHRVCTKLLSDMSLLTLTYLQISSFFFSRLFVECNTVHGEVHTTQVRTQQNPDVEVCLTNLEKTLKMVFV
jgi:hypothetical protein